MFNRAVNAFRKGIVARKSPPTTPNVADGDNQHRNDDNEEVLSASSASAYSEGTHTHTHRCVEVWRSAHGDDHSESRVCR